MVLEISRETQFGYWNFEQAHSIVYESEPALARIFYLASSDGVLIETAATLHREAIKGNTFQGTIPNMSMETWDESNELISCFIRNEELKVVNIEPWAILKTILIGNFDPQKILEKISKIGLIGQDTDLWGLLKELTLFKRNSNAEI